MYIFITLSISLDFTLVKWKAVFMFFIIQCLCNFRFFKSVDIIIIIILSHFGFWKWKDFLHFHWFSNFIIIWIFLNDSICTLFLLSYYISNFQLLAYRHFYYFSHFITFLILKNPHMLNFWSFQMKG